MSAYKKPTGLGRGLDALLGDYNISPAVEGAEAAQVPITELRVNPDQPRKRFEQERLKELAASISRHGMVQPIVVRKEADGYTIITGERRFRAAQLLKMTTVPIVERGIEDEQLLEIALVENIQREDLNPIEEAAAIAYLMRQHDLTQEEAAERLCKSRPAIANALRLLSLSEPVKDMLRDGRLSAGHGRALLSLPDKESQERLANQAVKNRHSVRAVEQMAAALLASGAKPSTARSASMPEQHRLRDPDLYDMETKLRERLSTKVKLTGSKRRGKITIEYFSKETLEGIYDVILGDFA